MQQSIITLLTLLIFGGLWSEEGKIIDIGSEPGGAYTQCISKEEFNICTAEPEGWDLSLVEKEEICFGY